MYFPGVGVLVASLVDGRGLDVPDLVCVINYSCPNHLEDYVHRVGRTGRAGRKGTAYTFISQEEEQHAPTLIKALTQSKQKVTVMWSGRAWPCQEASVAGGWASCLTLPLVSPRDVTVSGIEHA